MIQFPQAYFYAFKEIFLKKKYIFLLPLLTGFLFITLILIPVITTPGNDLAFQWSIMGKAERWLLAVLSFLTALTLIMHIFMFSQKRSRRVAYSMVGQTGAGVVSGVIASLFGAASCAACLGTIFSLLGFGSVLFLLEYRLVITVGAILILIISLYFNSKKVLGYCESCRV